MYINYCVQCFSAVYPHLTVKKRKTQKQKKNKHKHKEMRKLDNVLE